MATTLEIPELDEIWLPLDNEITWLHAKWLIYKQLYGTDEKRIAILDKAASNFFHIIQHTLLNDIQLSIAKLNDPDKTKGNSNLSIHTLYAIVAKLAPAINDLPKLVSEFSRSCTKIKHRRNKWIGHFDLKTLTDPAIGLIGPSRDEINASLEALRKVMNCIALHFTGSQTLYEEIILQNDGEHLLRTLEQGSRYRELVLSGLIPRSDLHHSEE